MPGLSHSLSCPAGAEPSPALLVPSAKRRSRKTSKDTGESKDGAAPGSEEPGAKARGRGRKPSTKAKSGMFWGSAHHDLGPAALLGCLHRDPLPACAEMLTGSKLRALVGLSEAELRSRKACTSRIQCRVPGAAPCCQHVGTVGCESHSSRSPERPPSPDSQGSPSSRRQSCRPGGGGLNR